MKPCKTCPHPKRCDFENACTCSAACPHGSGMKFLGIPVINETVDSLAPTVPLSELRELELFHAERARNGASSEWEFHAKAASLLCRLVPLSEHQRAQAEAAALREALSQIMTYPNSNLRATVGSIIHDEAQAALASTAGRSLLARLERAEREASELQSSADLRLSADERAIARWQEATGRVHVLPDHADLCVWLMEQLERAEKERDEARAESISLRSDLDVERQRAQDWEARVRRAVEEEREACAKVAEEWPGHGDVDPLRIASAIRARGVEGK